MTPLDNPVHGALTSVHDALSISHGGARRYPYAVARYAGLATPAAFGDLRAITEPEDSIRFFTPAALTVPAPWTVTSREPIEQMLATRPLDVPRHELVPLAADDVPAMLELATLTRPGPFFTRTIELGRYLGVKRDGRLVAMAGERLKLDGFTEISGLCTHPGHRGQGYGRSLLAALVDLALGEGKAPFLHVRAGNQARASYERLGFATRAHLHLTVVRRGRY